MAATMITRATVHEMSDDDLRTARESMFEVVHIIDEEMERRGLLRWERTLREMISAAMIHWPEDDNG
jgi:hypothetical protein